MKIEDHAAGSARHQQRAWQLHERVTDHNARVRHWNERGGAPPDTVLALRSAGAAFDAEHNRLDERHRQLDAEARRLQGEQDRFAAEVQDHARQQADFEATFPPGSVESGQYCSTRMPTTRPARPPPIPATSSCCAPPVRSPQRPESAVARR